MISTKTARIPSSMPIQPRSWLANGGGTAAEGCGAPIPCSQTNCAIVRMTKYSRSCIREITVLIRCLCNDFHWIWTIKKMRVMQYQSQIETEWKCVWANPWIFQWIRWPTNPSLHDWSTTTTRPLKRVIMVEKHPTDGKRKCNEDQTAPILHHSRKG